ncbi:MAG: RNA-binding domain-containing protein [Armatimonadota bacterium]
MSNPELIALVDRLCNETNETEWLEFKRNRYEPQELGEYISALANGACLAGKPRGYILFGVDDESHNVVDTKFDPHTAKGKGNQSLLIWLRSGLQPNTGFEVHIVNHPNGRIVLFEIHPAWDRPVKFYGKAFIRIGSSKTNLEKHPDKERAIWNRHTDWSAQVCERATIADLDSVAIQMAREQFKIKNPRQIADVDSWDDITFLNKAKLTIQGAISHAAIVLLGKPESAALLSPAVAKISWILKDAHNQELDYEHFGPPFVLAVDKVLSRIRNLTIRTLPSGTLFPQEITQYDPWVIREALHNCIAHQDYSLHGRINIVETSDSILLTNMGSFLPGDIETVICQDAPLEIYRNPVLAEAMVGLNMIDTQGGGIKRMFRTQMQRFFPLPDFDFTEPDRVAVKIQGRIIDEQYTRLLMANGNLDLWQVIQLDRVQKQLPISRDAHRRLKAANLVEGRYPNIIVAALIAKATGQKARYIRDRGFDKKYYLDAILALVNKHGPVDRKDINALLLEKLPEVLTESQKKSKIHNLLAELAREGKIYNTGTRPKPRWQIVKSDDDLSNHNEK